MIEIIDKKTPVDAHVVCSGLITGQKLVNMNEKLVANQALTYALIDFTPAESVSFTQEDIHKIAIQDKLLPPDAQMPKKKWRLSGKDPS